MTPLLSSCLPAISYSKSSLNHHSSALKQQRRLSSASTWFQYSSGAYPLINRNPKLNMIISHAVIKQIIPSGQLQQPDDDDHWAFCYTMLHKISKNFAAVVQQLDPQFRDAACILYLAFRAIDTVEDDTSIPPEVRVPILNAFHRHIYDSKWHFPCGTRQYDKVLMDGFRHFSNAFLDLDQGCQEAIEDIIKRIGAGMAKYIGKEIESIDDCDEYSYYVGTLTFVGFCNVFRACGVTDFPSESLVNSMGLLYMQPHYIQDYLEDINEMPEPRMNWPREIWGKYVSNLEDLKYEENSVKAVECLNEMATQGLIYVEDSLLYISALKESSLFRFYAVLQIMTFGNLALCYNNVEVFRSFVVLSPDLRAKVFDETETMADVYGAFFDFSCTMKSKVNMNDPNASLTLSRLDTIQKVCIDSGLLNKRKLYVL